MSENRRSDAVALAGLEPADWHLLLREVPAYARALEAMAEIPARRAALDRKTQHLIGVAVNASTTRLFEPALRSHLRSAIEAGATKDELIEALELASALGVHTATMGMPVLREELQRAGLSVAQDLDERQAKIKTAFTQGRSSWTVLLEDFLRLDPDWLEAYVAYSTVPWKRGALEPMVKELIYVAIDAQTSHLYAPGTRFHIRNALVQGASRDQIVETLELVSLIGAHTMLVSLPILIGIDASDGEAAHAAYAHAD